MSRNWLTRCELWILCVRIIPFILFDRNVISAFSSGTGAAGVAGAMTYAALISLQFSPKSTLLVMLIVPLIQLIAFCFLLREPNRAWTTLSSASSATSLIDHTYGQDTSNLQPSLSFKQRLRFMPKLLKYILPLFTVYLCEYLINQVRSKSKMQLPYDHLQLSSDAFYFFN